MKKKKIKKSFDLINNIVKFLKNRSKPNVSHNLNSGWAIFKKYNIFFWQQEKNAIKSKHELIKKPLLHFSSKENLLFFCFSIQKIFYDEDSITPPFFLRKRKSGDILKFSFGKQKLKKFFINSKIPLIERNKIWLVVDQKNTIIWIPNLYKNTKLGKNKIIYLGLQK
ncbi:MAG: tRNA lysidine(34) synthetase TilS [Candidatus Phytoplasma stylosanthis]|uniref:tRNA lysidine(34) synthetase TilS n=1 Tax=Candidatus Phytoplasma stylosanthis TaxID=2798314 RepID=UPI002939E443|nr:tRNA lysidine(34) synthetase TilS [Candidatus Phytoplasma stylosanthis]MDV3174018.1 tRNA lysidine(34) synthetase TilS [Candidatus Phytoplasma stylosanthis]